MFKIKGFTLIELLIVIAIIGILAAIAVPTYIKFDRKAYFAEVIQATAPFKAAVETCYQTQGALTNCTGGSNGIPANLTTATGNVSSISVLAGVITATPTALHGLTAADTYVLTPTPTNNVLIWAPSGGCVADSVC